MERRTFVKSMAVTGAGAMLSSTLPNWATAKQQSPTQEALIMDSMAEIRLTHTRELIKEVIDSGTNSVTVTLCDPKLQEQEAYELALAELLAYDRHRCGITCCFSCAHPTGVRIWNVDGQAPTDRITWVNACISNGCVYVVGRYTYQLWRSSHRW